MGWRSIEVAASEAHVSLMDNVACWAENQPKGEMRGELGSPKHLGFGVEWLVDVRDGLRAPLPKEIRDQARGFWRHVPETRVVEWRQRLVVTERIASRLEAIGEGSMSRGLNDVCISVLGPSGRQGPFKALRGPRRR